MKYKTFYKKKIYQGMAELRSYEVHNILDKGLGAKIIVGDEYMLLTPSQLRKGKVSNTQHSIINEGQTYQMWGYEWKPTRDLDASTGLNYGALSGMVNTPDWEKLREKLHS